MRATAAGIESAGCGGHPRPPSELVGERLCELAKELHWAERTYGQIISSPKRELKIFSEREGGVQHSSFDNSANAGAYIADRVAENPGGRTSLGER